MAILCLLIVNSFVIIGVRRIELARGEMRFTNSVVIVIKIQLIAVHLSLLHTHNGTSHTHAFPLQKRDSCKASRVRYLLIGDRRGELGSLPGEVSTLFESVHVEV